MTAALKRFWQKTTATASRFWGWLCDSRFSRIEIAVFGAIFLLLFYSFIYNDIIDTTLNGMMLWRALVQGRLDQYYSVNVGVMPTPYTQLWPTLTANYDFGIYAVFGLWDFPLWLLYDIFHVEVLSSFWGMAYAKTILLIPLFLSSWFIYKICVHAGLDRRTSVLACFVFLFSAHMTHSLTIISQYDIFSACFMLGGVYFLARERNILAYVLFAYAVNFKLFAVLFIIPILLATHKNLLKSVFFTALIILPGLFIHWLFSKIDPAFYYAAITQNGLLGTALGLRMQFGATPVILFFVVYGLLCIWAFLHRQREDGGVSMMPFAKRIYVYSFVGAVVFIAFQLLANATPYWSVLIVPFVTILCFLNPKRFTPLSLAAVLGAFFYTLSTISAFPGLWIPKYTAFMLPSLFHPIDFSNSAFLGQLGTGAAEVLGKLIPQYYGLLFPVFASIALACYIALIWFAYPGQNWAKEESLETGKLARWPLYLSALASLAVTMCFFVPYIYAIIKTS